jgi:hypothetical protein
MGLDMYLYKRLYTKNWDFTPEESRIQVTVVKNDKVLEDFDNPTYVTAQVASWRKFNALHGHIVDTYADGEDNYQDIYLSYDDLCDILKLLKEVRDTKDFSKLPPTAGFFFGSKDVDEYYWYCVGYTINTLEDIISKEDSEEVDYIYNASW